MVYGFYPQRRRFRSKGMRTVAVTKPKTTYKRYKKNNSKKSAPTFTQKVKSIIARDIENKYTTTVTYKAPVSDITSTQSPSGPTVQVYNGYKFNPYSLNMFQIPQGTNIQERVGNKIKLKRWVIKGLIQPNDTFSFAPPLASQPSAPSIGIAPNTLAGYVTIYFGKYQVNLAPIQTTPITNFYQLGATDITPQGLQVETLYNVNRDLYKVYFKKRFKMGVGAGFSGGQSTLAYDPEPTVPGANGFGLTRSFGFDVTKYILKNKTILFDELVQSPQNPDIQNLTLWATFHPAAGDFGYVPASGQGTTNNSFYNISAMSYAEYEDA